MNPAVVVVGYNRPDCLLRLLNSIENAYYGEREVTLIISIDKAEDDHGVLQTAESFRWNHGEKIIRTFPERQGLRKHIISCGDLSEKYEAVIVLEDDLLVSPGYYQYVCDALEYYSDDRIAGIALYSHEWNGYAGRFFEPVADEYDTYLGQFSITWGQCWTKKGWRKFKEWYDEHENQLAYNGKIPAGINEWPENSWGKYFVNYITETNRFYVIPRISLSTNCSEIGEHADEEDSDHQVRLLNATNLEYRFAPIEKACKYDIYFENMELKQYFSDEIVKDGIDIDLNDTKKNNPENRYLLTTAKKKYKIVKTFGMRLRPIDMNIIYGIEGREIRLYDKSISYENMGRDTVFETIMRYEIRGMRNKNIIRYINSKVKRKICKRLRIHYHK